MGLLVTAAVAYFPGLNGPFVFDDFNNIVDNKGLATDTISIDSLRQAALSGFAGPLKRPLSMMSFAVNIALTGKDPFYFKATNVAIHLINGLLVFGVVRLLLRLHGRISESSENFAASLALVTTAIWLLHPAQLTSVLYVVQRMTSLSATFVFAALWVYLLARQRMMDDAPYRVLLWCIVPLLGLAGMLAKENAALVFAFMLCIEVTLLRFRQAGAARIGSLLQFHVLLTILPLVLGAALMILRTDWSAVDSVTHPFTARERLMTEALVMGLYLKILLVPSLPDLALFYDDFPISTSLLSPPTTLVAVVLVLGAIGFAVVRRRQWPWFSFAVLWFFAAHLIESTVVLLELVHVHRNYIAYLGPILAGVVGLHRLLGRQRLALAVSLASLTCIALALSTFQRAVQWNDPFALAAYEVHHRPGSSRANYELGRLYYLAELSKPNPTHRRSAMRHFMRAMELDPRSIGAPIAMMIISGGPNYKPLLEVRAELLRRLRERPLNSKEIHFVRSLVDCQERKICRRPPAEILEVLGQALSQRAVSPRIKADLLAILGMYYARHMGDLAACIRAMEDSVRLVPDAPNYRLNLVQAYLLVKNFESAQKMLTEAERNDLLGIYGTRIEILKKDMSELKKDPS
jgi:protein O-mannosyl-transferase